MTRDDILNLSGRDLDGAIAENVYGYVYGKTPKDCNGLNGGEDILLPKNIKYSNFRYPPKGKISKYYHVPEYSKSYDEVYKLEEKIKEMGIQREYSYKLFFAVLDLECNFDDGLYYLIHAGLEQRCKAILLAILNV